MIDLSKKSMYPMSPMDDMSCPRITLPMKILAGKKYNVGDNFKITLSGEISSIFEDQYSSDVTFEVDEGEVSPQAAEKDEEKE